MTTYVSASVQETYTRKMIAFLPTLRAACGVTQSQLAQMIGVSRQTITSIEREKRPLTWSMYLALVAVFSQCPSACTMLQSFDLFDKELVKCG